MRVAFIVEKFPNVSETFILEEIVGAIKRGIDVDIYAFRRGTQVDIHPAYTAFELQTRTFYCIPSVDGGVARRLAAYPATVAMLRSNPLAFLRCITTRKRGVQTRTFVSLARTFITSGHSYDVVHAHFGPNGIRAEVLRRATALDAPLITTFHGYDATSFVLEHGSSVYHDLASGGERFIAVSESIARSLSAIGFPSARTTIMPLGVDCSRFAPAQRQFGQDAIKVVSVGRFVEKKGFEFGVRAVAEARKRYPGLTYDIIGDGELRHELEALIVRLNAGGFVTLHGYKNQTDVGLMLARADIMLAPSVTATDGDSESMPIVIKEAMARGLPVVASFHAGIPEIVVNGATGLLADERDYKTLADHLVALAADGAKRQAFGVEARRVIETHFDNEDLIDALVALYRDVARERQAVNTDR